VARKTQQYFILKFNTDRLKNANNNVTITINDARRNGELISIGDSQVLKSLRAVKKQDYDQQVVNSLVDEKRRIKNKSSSSGNSYRLREINIELDRFLFIPEIISVVVKNIKSYNEIIKRGLFVNNKKYVRLLCGAGMARRNTVWLIDSEYDKPLKKLLNNNRNDIEINPSKFNAYFALSASTSLEVSKPYFCVVPDLEIERNEHVEFVIEQENGDDIIEECDKDLVFNIFDGQGVISPRKAQEWADELELDYIPSAFIIRSNFVKGLVAVIDFVEFSDMIGKHIIKDIYGKDTNIRDMDIILTKSQFKLADAFDSQVQYNANCKENDLGWWVSRYAPKHEKKHAYMNYQFLQALNLDKDRIEGICQKTVDYFHNILSGDLDYTTLYLLGEHLTSKYDADVLDKVSDNVAKAVVLNKNLIADPYVKRHISNSLARKMKDSYIGRLIIDGFYTFMVSDPYAFLEYIFDLPIKGLLERDEYYNRTWLDKKESKIAAMRAPLTWRSEVDVLTLKDGQKKRDWYKYLDNCVIFNIHGMDMAILAGGDFDGDIVCLTNDKNVIDGVYGGLPIFYDTNKAPKMKIVEKELYLHDSKGFNTKVGFLTNCSTTMYAMLPKYDKESAEYKEIVRRLKQCRKEQGVIIDGTKGLVVKPMPKHWTQWQGLKDKTFEDEVIRARFNNSILIDKRPIFMTELYTNYARDYRKHVANYDLFCRAKFCMELEELLLIDESKMSEKQIECVRKFNYYSPFLSTDCEVNNIFKYMQKSIKHIRYQTKAEHSEDLVNSLKDGSTEFDKEKLKQLYNLYKKYKNNKRNFFEIKDESGESRYKTIDQYNKSVRISAFSISSDICELASLAVNICYEMHPKDNKVFAWSVFGEGIVKNIIKNIEKDVEVPFLDDSGNIEYLGSRYKRSKIEVKEDIYDILREETRGGIA